MRMYFSDYVKWKKKWCKSKRAHTPCGIFTSPVFATWQKLFSPWKGLDCSRLEPLDTQHGLVHVSISWLWMCVWVWWLEFYNSESMVLASTKTIYLHRWQWWKQFLWLRQRSALQSLRQRGKMKGTKHYLKASVICLSCKKKSVAFPSWQCSQKSLEQLSSNSIKHTTEKQNVRIVITTNSLECIWLKSLFFGYDETGNKHLESDMCTKHNFWEASSFLTNPSGLTISCHNNR